MVETTSQNKFMLSGLGCINFLKSQNWELPIKTLWMKLAALHAYRCTYAGLSNLDRKKYFHGFLILSIYSFPFHYKCIILILFVISFCFLIVFFFLASVRLFVLLKLQVRAKAYWPLQRSKIAGFQTAKQPIRWRNFTEISCSHKMCILSGWVSSRAVISQLPLHNIFGECKNVQQNFEKHLQNFYKK